MKPLRATLAVTLLALSVATSAPAQDNKLRLLTWSRQGFANRRRDRG